MSDYCGSPSAGPSTLGVSELIDDPLPLSESSVPDQTTMPFRENGAMGLIDVEANHLGEASTIPQNISDRYMPWFFDRNELGILPRPLSSVWRLVYMVAAVVCCLNVITVGLGRPLRGAWLKNWLINPINVIFTPLMASVFGAVFWTMTT